MCRRSIHRGRGGGGAKRARSINSTAARRPYNGRMAAVAVPELTADAVARAAVQIARPLGKDPNTEPVIDARLADGSRVAICGPPAAPTGAITIRRFGGRAFTVKELTASGSLPAPVVDEAAAVPR